MTIEQQTFLGSTVSSFQATIGWDEEPSRLTVNLVDDPRLNQTFNPGGLYRPVQFDFNGWTFNGIIENYRAKHSDSGAPLYEVQIVDPRRLLDGTQLILNNYAGTVYDVPNLINVYGYLESFGFGNADVNESGIPWLNVKNAVQQMLLTVSGNTYGTALNYYGERYAVDLDNLPVLPAAYRIGGDSISLMDFIRDVCAAASCRFFFTLQFIAGVNVIKLWTISHLTQPEPGKINEFIAGLSEYISAEVGREATDMPTSKFLFGGNVEQIYFQFYSNQNTVAGNDDTIWSFWGFDPEGNPVVGEGFGDDHEFTLDSRTVNVYGVGSTYKTNVAELRAALGGQASWETYLWLHNNDRDDDDEPMAHTGKANRVGIISNSFRNIKDYITDTITDREKFENINPFALFGLSRDQVNAAAGLFYGQEENVARLYEYVHSFAQEFMGRKFMVRIPFVYVEQSPETEEIILSLEPTDGGFIEESYWANAVGYNLLPLDVNRLTQENGKIQAYVRFINAHQLDFSEINPDDIIYDNTVRPTAFIKCQVESGVIFLNREALFSPRVVITLPGIVKPKNGLEAWNYGGVLVDYLVEHGTDVLNLSISETRTIVDKLFALPGADSLLFNNGPAPTMPDMAAVPLKNNTLTYGPWYAVGAAGKVEVEHDSSLVPWNYGGFDAMNTVANAKIIQAYANQAYSEEGAVEFPGIPVLSLGDALISNGPYITDIQVSIGDRITTLYRMRTWTPDFGRLTQSMAATKTRLAITEQRNRRQFRELLKSPPPPNAKVYANRERAIINRKQSKSSGMVLIGQNLLDGDGKRSVVSLEPQYNAISKIANNYEHKAVSSLDGIFRPFSTNPDYSGNLPHFERPTGSLSGEPTVDDLNPFIVGHDIAWLTQDSNIPPSNYYTSEYSLTDDYRGIALRSPLILCGWGYDTNGNIVPSGSNYIGRTNDWKVGPLDARWNDNRKVWEAGGSAGGGLIRAICRSTNIEPYSTGLVDIISGTDDTVITASITARSWIGNAICEGQRLFLTTEEGRYYIVQGEFNQLDVVTNVYCDPDTGMVVKCVRTLLVPSSYSSETCE